MTCNVTGTGGTGNLTANPNPFSWTYTSNSGSFPSQSVGLFSSTGATTYSASAKSSNGWLLVNGSTSTQGVSISSGLTASAGSNINSLLTGTYDGFISVTDSNGGTTSITVHLTVNGGNSGGLTISPNPLFFNSSVGGGTLQQTVTVTSSTGGTFIVTGSSTGWLSWQQNTSTITAGGSGTITVFAAPSSLNQNTYLGSLGITVGSQSATVSVTLQVGSGGGGTTTTNVAPTSLVFTYQTNTPANFVAQQKIAITGPQGAWSSSVSMGNGTGWLALSPASGSTLPDAATVVISPSLLPVGNYSGTITVTTPGGTQNVTVNLAVTSGAVLLPTPGSLLFNYQVGSAAPPGQNVFFSASDGSLLAITAVASDTWITVTPTASSMAVSVDPTGKSAGVYSGSVSVTQTGLANSPMVVPVVLVVNGGGTGTTGPLTFVPTSLQFSSVSGAAPLAQTLSVSANNATSFTAVATVQNGGFNWLSVTPVSASTNANAQVSVNPAGLVAGTYNGTVTFTANGINQGVPVTLTVSGTGTSSLTVTPASLSFSAQSGAGLLPAQTLAVTSATGAAGVGFAVAVTSGSAWLSVSAFSGTTPFNTPGISVTANATGLTAATYNGTIQILPVGGTAVNVPVTLTVTAPPTIVSATPATLTFTYKAGDALPASLPISVSGGGGTLTFSATASSNGNWLSVSPASGTTPATGAATVNVSVSPVNLATGDYQGTVTVVGTGAATGSTSIQVNLKVTAPLPTISRLTNAGSFASGAIAPGEIVTLFGVNIGPVTPAGLALDSSGKVATLIGGTQVLVLGIPAPMIYASGTQVSAVVPYELAGFATANVQVKFLGQTSNAVPVNVATTAPGLFTLNSSGTGPAAILNSNNSINSPTNPANRGDTVVIYMTGEGQTSPAGVTGKVTTVAAVAPLTPGPLLLVSVLVGGQPANYTFAGEAPGFVSGVLQLNVTIPTNIAAGDQSLVVSIGGNPSQSGVTVSVR